MTETLAEWVIGGYVLCLSLLALLSWHRLELALRGRRQHVARPRLNVGQAPEVLVQIPLYNEPYVAERVIRSVAALDYPKNKFKIQVLDDSTDDTPARVAKVVDELRAQGFGIEHLQRESRKDYKAGALRFGMTQSDAPFIAIFDADFVVPKDFLNDLIGHFVDPEIAMVQARWGHLNADSSVLSAAQSVLLDGHFMNEHGGRAASNWFFNFNGTAGIWRRDAIVDAGGWSGVSITEDLDLSYRAQLAGWRFVYRPDIVVNAELPDDVDAFKAQQHRWAKGAIEVAKIRLASVLRTPMGFRKKYEACLHLCANVSYIFALLLALLLPWAGVARAELPSFVGLHYLDLTVFLSATLSWGASYAIALHRSQSLRKRWYLLPLVLALGVGLSINNVKALLEALMGYRTPFVRTPKAGEEELAFSKQPRSSAWGTYILEILLAVYLVLGIGMVVDAQRYSAIPLLLLFALGFGFLGGKSLVLRIETKVRARNNAWTLTPSRKSL